MELPEVHGVHEGDVVGWVPVQAVAVQVEGHGVYQPVDGLHHLTVHRDGCTSSPHWALAHLLAVLLRGAVGDGEGAGDEVVLHVHDDDRRPRSHNLA